MFSRLFSAKTVIFVVSRRKMAYQHNNGSAISFPARMVVPRAHVYAMGGGMCAFWYLMCYGLTYVIKEYRETLDQKQ